MRPTSKLSVSLAAISLGLVLAFGNSGRTDDPTKGEFSIQLLEQKRLAETPVTKPTLKELERERLKILEQASDFATQLFQNARVEYTDVLVAQRELLAARLEYAETKQDRIKACDEAIKLAGQLKELAEAHKRSARGTQLAVFRAQAYELEAQIARAKAEAEK